MVLATLFLSGFGGSQPAFHDVSSGDAGAEAGVEVADDTAEDILAVAEFEAETEDENEERDSDEKDFLFVQSVPHARAIDRDGVLTTTCSGEPRQWLGELPEKPPRA
jgi:hypothetical protein